MYCPPYHNYETYDDGAENQSTTQYKTYEEWRRSYLAPTLNTCYQVLRENGTMGYIIANYKKYDLIGDMRDICISCGFSFVDSYRIGVANGAKKGNTVEQLVLWRKKTCMRQ